MSQEQHDCECPICMDNIDHKINCITTECGHRFHASCMMRNVSTNGFACPMCRSVMAEEDDEDEDMTIVPEVHNDPNPDDNALRGLRLFMNNVEGVEHDQEDILEEHEENGDAPAPPVEYIVNMLISNGTTMADLVKILLRDHAEYEDDEIEFDQIDERIWASMRTIISNYQPEVMSPVEVPATPPPAAPVTPEAVAAEPEIIHPNITTRQKRHRTGIVPHLNSVAANLFENEDD